MKNLNKITPEQLEELCKLLGHRCISYATDKELSFYRQVGLAFSVQVKSTAKGDLTDSTLRVYNHGTVELHSNTGGWNGAGFESINGLIVTDYLRKQGYGFEY